MHKSAFAAAALAFLAYPLQSWGQTGPIRIPKDGEGYTVTPSNTRSEPAPEGYAGRTDAETLTAIGNTPATTGKTIVARFLLANKIKICPAADGTSEGTGVFSLNLDYTDDQPSGITRLHIEMKADATYKGEVGDDAWLINPIRADIDYTYTLSGSIKDRSGAIATPAGSNSAQHVNIEFTAGRGLSAPDIGAFSGGDPTAGRYEEAFVVGVSLVYWAGVYYSEAQTQWRDPGRCVKAEFTPPSHTSRLVPGGRTTVKSEVKTKTGEVVRAQFLGGRTRGGGAVAPTEGSSDVGAPMTFEFTAPTQKVATTGFSVDATSPAGIAEDEWIAGLGTDWSGTISFVTTHTGDAGVDELLTWSNTSASNIRADLRDGKGRAYGYTELRHFGMRRQKALRGGSVTIIFDSSTLIEGTLSDEVPAGVEIVYPTNGTYAIRLLANFKKEGKTHIQSCNRNTGCQDAAGQLTLPGSLPGMTGRVDDPNRLQGSKTETKTGMGYRGTGTVTTTITWDLAREGTGK